MVRVTHYIPDLDKIRRRKSYQRFNTLASMLQGDARYADVLHMVHGMINDMCGYRSQQNADYARESLELVLRERGLT